VANQLLTIGMVTMESLPVLVNELKFARSVRRDFDNHYGDEGAQIGDTLAIRKPPKFIGRVGQGFSPEDATENSVQLTLTTQFGQDTLFTSKDFALNIENFDKRFLHPAIARIANKIDSDGLFQYLNVFNAVGTPGTPPNALLTYLQAVQKLNDNAAAIHPRAIIIGQAFVPPIVDTLKGLFHSSEEIEEQYREGYMGLAIGCNWAMDQNVQVNTIGPLGGAPTVNAGGQSGASLITNNWTNAAAKRLLKGNCFTIGSGATGVFSVNPQEKTNQTSLLTFTCAADASSDGSGNLTISIIPSIVGSGPFQNVSQLPPAGATINVIGAANTPTPQALVFHEGSFALGMAPLPKIRMSEMCEVKYSEDLNVGMRYLKVYDVNTDRLPGRFDTLYGWQTLYSETACRVMG